MASVQTAQSRAALSLLAVLIVAKTMMLAGREVAPTPWLPLAYFWQDVLVALAFGLFARLTRQPLLVLACYALIAAYVALNVPISLQLSSPLSLSMIKAARGPLEDSVAAGLTTRNVAAIAAVLGVAVLIPWIFTRLRAEAVSPPTRRLSIVAALVWIVAGASASARIDTRGLHRNAIGALIPAAVPVSASNGTAGDWRVTATGAPSVDDLRTMRGVARGQNVILIALESTAAQYLGLYGASVDPMPNLTRLAAHALVFDRMYAVYPESIKGLYTTLCSRTPAYRSDADSLGAAPCDAMPQVFKSAGYRTALFHSGRFDYLGMRAVIDGRGFDVLEDAGAIGGQADSSFGIDEASTVDRMLQWIDAAPEKRFFLSYLPIAGHHPYATTRPGPFKGGTQFDQYLNALHESDAALGQLLDGLRARHRDRDTLIVLYGDHGEGFGQHDGNTGHTLFIYDENVRVPFVVALPDWTDAGRAEQRVTRVASQLDTAPTILDLAGLPHQSRHQGNSLLEPTARLAPFYTDYSLGWLGLADGCWTYQYQVESKRSALFDSCRDPGQTTDRSSEHAAQTAAYRDRVTAWITKTREVDGR